MRCKHALLRVVSLWAGDEWRGVAIICPRCRRFRRISDVSEGGFAVWSGWDKNVIAYPDGAWLEPIGPATESWSDATNAAEREHNRRLDGPVFRAVVLDLVAKNPKAAATFSKVIGS